VAGIFDMLGLTPEQQAAIMAQSQGTPDARVAQAWQAMQGQQQAPEPPVTQLPEISVQGNGPVPMPTPRPAMPQQATSPTQAPASPAAPAPNGAAVLAGFAPHSAPAPAPAGAQTLVGGAGGDALTAARTPQAPASGGGLGGIFGGDFGERLGAMLSGWAMGRTPGESLAYGGRMLAAGNAERSKKREAKEQQNRTVQWLTTQGVGDQEAQYLAGDKEALQAWYKDWRTGNKPEWKIETIYDDKGKEQRVMIDMKSGKFNPIGGSKAGDRKTSVVNDRLVDSQTGQVIADYSAEKTGARAERGLQPVWGEDANGNPVILQLGKDGAATQTQIPQGVKLRKDPIRLDAGTQWVLIDPVTRQAIATVPKDVAGEASGRAQGKALGEAATEVAPAQIGAEHLRRQIDDLKNDPDFDKVIGPIQGRTPNVSAGARRVQAKIDQLKGGAFLQAFQALKGGGAITEMEGQKASEAMARMDQAQNEGDFRKALDDFNDAVQTGVAKIRARAGQTSPQAAPSATPQVRRYNPATGTLD
jgi:hypothetical protein